MWKWLRLAGDPAERKRRMNDVVIAERFDPLDVDSARMVVAEFLKSDTPEAPAEHRKPLTLARARRRARLGVVSMSLIGWAGLLAVVAANATVFALLGGNYFTWYLNSASVIALVFSALSLGVSLDAFPMLISAEPLGYFMGLLDVGGDVYRGQASPISRRRTDGELRDLPEGAVVCSWYRSVWLDDLLAYVFTWFVVLMFYAWVFVVAPLQYWVNLVTGAPARAAMASAETVWMTQDGTLSIYTAGKKANRPEGSREVSFGANPVTTTALLSAVVFWFVNLVVGGVS